MLRNKINDDIKAAMRAKEPKKLGTLRTIMSKIKDQDLALAGQQPIGDADILQVLTKMIKQRRDSIEAFDKAGRAELARQERDEIALIEVYMPKQMDEAATRGAIAAAIQESGAASPKEMGKVMALLKARYAGQMDFGKVSGIVKELLQ